MTLLILLNGFGLTTISEQSSPVVSLACWLQYRYASGSGPGGHGLEQFLSFFSGRNDNMINLLRYSHLLSENTSIILVLLNGNVESTELSLSAELILNYAVKG